ncbi:MAG: right-handed parallel beta-helix repeat-containing protein, partial [Myxococcales bacterium]|nr:right-handed parallel beta-helix repeat-containing protein [Myxococcales bacterium]
MGTRPWFSSALLSLLLLGTGFNASAATFVVNSSGDEPDSSPGDGDCLTDGSVCTLRAAVQEANSTPAVDTITFAISSQSIPVITLQSLSITRPLVIDGTTQTQDWVALALDGESTLTIEANNTTLRGLNIRGGQGTLLELSVVSGVTIEDNRIGTGSAGSADGTPSTSGVCIRLEDAAANNIRRNVISGCGVGLEITGSGSSENIVTANLIGTDRNGTSAIPNDAAGVWIHNGAANNRIGSSSDQNVISGNGGPGVLLGPESQALTGNRVLGNLIGLSLSGGQLGNSGAGIEIRGSGSNIIGEGENTGNVISGNDSDGIYIHATENEAADTNFVSGNFIGTNTAGSVAIPNDGWGIRVSGSTHNLLGGDNEDRANLISGNDAGGILLTEESSDNDIAANIIGLDWLQNRAVGNGGPGVQIDQDSTSNVIGDRAANVISGNQG